MNHCKVRLGAGYSSNYDIAAVVRYIEEQSNGECIPIYEVGSNVRSVTYENVHQQRIVNILQVVHTGRNVIEFKLRQVHPNSAHFVPVLDISADIPWNIFQLSRQVQTEPEPIAQTVVSSARQPIGLSELLATVQAQRTEMPQVSQVPEVLHRRPSPLSISTRTSVELPSGTYNTVGISPTSLEVWNDLNSQYRSFRPPSPNSFMPIQNSSSSRRNSRRGRSRERTQ